MRQNKYDYSRNSTTHTLLFHWSAHASERVKSSTSYGRRQPNNSTGHSSHSCDTPPAVPCTRTRSRSSNSRSKSAMSLLVRARSTYTVTTSSCSQRQQSSASRHRYAEMTNSWTKSDSYHELDTVPNRWALDRITESNNLRPDIRCYDAAVGEDLLDIFDRLSNTEYGSTSYRSAQGHLNIRYNEKMNKHETYTNSIPAHASNPSSLQQPAAGTRHTREVIATLHGNRRIIQSTVCKIE